VWIACIYTVMSVFCYMLSTIDVSVQTGSKVGLFLWMLGPTSTLVVGTGYLALCFKETAMVGILMFASVGLYRHSRAAGMISWSVTAIVWLLCSLVLYSVAM
jgi:hypothetical protein